MFKRLVFFTLLLGLMATMPAHVGGVEENVKFVITDVTPKIVEPGYEGPLNVTIKNVGFGEGYRVNAEVTTSTTSPIRFLGETKKFRDFYTAECSDIVICNVLNAGDITTFSFDISIKDDAVKGVYYTPITITWRYAALVKQTTLNFGVEVEGEPDLIISSVSTSPSIIYPDTEFTMPIGIENIGTDTAKNAEITLTLVDGLSGKAVSPQGSILKDNLSTATFNLKAEKSIPLGHHTLQALLKYKNTNGLEYTKTFPVDLFIQDRGAAKIEISGVSTTPSKVYPNTDFTLTVTLENTGAQKAQAVKMTVVLPEQVTGEDTAFLGTIDESGSASATLDLKALKKAVAGKYPVTATITFTDEQGRESTIQKTFDLFILERGDVIIGISGKSTSPSKLLPGTEFTLSLQLENVGDQDAKSVRVELDPNGDFTGEFLSFVGEIEQDDVSTAVFDLAVSPLAQEGSRKVSARVTYTDERGEENTVIKTFVLFINSQGTTQTTPLVIIGAVVLLIIIFLWRRRKSEYSEA